MNSIETPTVNVPVVNVLPASRKGRGKNGTIPPVDPSVSTKAELVAQFDEAWNYWRAGKDAVDAAKEGLSKRQGSLVEVTARLARSGLFKDGELIDLVKSRAEKAGMTPQSASHALIACGLRQRAKRNDAGKTKGPKNPPANPPTETPANPVPAVSMAATPAASAPTLPSTPAELAKALVAKLGKEAAIQFIKASYTEASLG